MKQPLIFNLDQNTEDWLEKVLNRCNIIKQNKDLIASHNSFISSEVTISNESETFEFLSTSGLCRNLELQKMTLSCMPLRGHSITNIALFEAHSDFEEYFNDGIETCWNVTDAIFLLFCKNNNLVLDTSWPIGEKGVTEYNVYTLKDYEIRWKLLDFIQECLTEVLVKGTLTW